MGACLLCDEAILDAELPDHVRLLHPDADDTGLETWPDGGYVIEDQDPDMADLGGER